MTKLTIEQIARVAHEVNRSYSEAIGEPAKPSWEDAPEHQRVSLRKGIQFIIDNPNAQARDSHDSWMQEKIRTGWHWGPKLDEIRMEHPQFLPYEQIPTEQRAKDFIFSTLVKQLAAVEGSASVGYVNIVSEPVSDEIVQKIKQQFADAMRKDEDGK